MKNNRIRENLKAGDPVIGTMIQEVVNPFIIHAVANANFDFVYVDMEHGRFSMEGACDLIQMLRLTNVTPFVRVPNNEYHFIAKMLDAGAEGVMIPRVSCPEDVHRALGYMKYPPLGERGMAVARGHNDYQRENNIKFGTHANAENMLIIQIERKDALERIDELVSIPGVDVALIGPGDLSLDLRTALTPDNPVILDAIDKVAVACKKYNVTPGIHWGSREGLKICHDKGYMLLSGSSDLDILLDGLNDLRSGYRAAIS